MSEPYGCRITMMDHDASIAFLDTVTGAGEGPADDSCWLLAHCDDGVVWGARKASDGEWKLTGTLARERIQELRVFGASQETLLWRDDDDGSFRGRQLADDTTVVLDAWREPLSDSRVLIGDRVVAGPLNGGTTVADRAGSQQVVPLSVTADDFAHGKWLRLELRHYVADSEVPETAGALRIVASRLVDVRLEARA